MLRTTPTGQLFTMAEERESLLRGEEEEEEEEEEESKGGIEAEENGSRGEKVSALSVPVLVWLIESLGVWRVVSKRTRSVFPTMDFLCCVEGIAY